MSEAPFTGEGHPGVLAIWHSVDAATLADHEDWYRQEHLIERVSIPGFRRGTRWEAAERRAARRDGPQFFTAYETDSPAVLTGPDYAARLSSPTPWTQQVMPHLRGMCRTFCAEVARLGRLRGGVAMVAQLETHPGDDAWRELEARLPEMGARADVTCVRLWRAVDGTDDAPTRATPEAALRREKDVTIAGAVIVEMHRIPTDDVAAHFSAQLDDVLDGSPQVMTYRLLARLEASELDIPQASGAGGK